MTVLSRWVWLCSCAALLACGEAPANAELAPQQGGEVGSAVTAPAMAGPATGQSRPADLGEAKRIISGLDAAALSQKAVEERLGATLTMVPDEGPLKIVKATPAAGPFSEVELREAAKVTLVILTVRPGVALGLLDLRDVIPPDAAQSRNPAIPPEGVESYIAKRSGRETRFQFGAQSKLLQLVSFQQKK
jgi:hypothetical protein